MLPASSIYRRGLFLLAAVLSSGQAAAQPEPPSVFGDQIEVRVVNVEAVVIDASGRRVEGLTARSFRLEVDGTEVPIEFFTEVREGRVIGGGGELPGELGASATAADGLAPTHFLVFIDDFFAVGAERNTVLARLADQLELLGTNDQMAILAYDGARLEVLSGWTGSREELRQALAAAARRKAKGAFRRMERRGYLATLSNAAAGGPLGPGTAGELFDIGTERLPLSLIERRRAQLTDQVENVVKAATAGMRGLEAPQGRKVMLLLSGGWPLEPAGLDGAAVPALFGTVEERADGLELLRLQGGRGLYGSLADTANHLGFTLYPIDVPATGWTGPDAANELPGAGFDGSERGQEAVLFRLARQTGGRALLNGLRTRALERVLDDTRSYYWIGFTAQVLGNDRRHRVHLEVTEPGLRLRSRREFVDLSRLSDTRMLVEGGLLVSGGELPGELSVELGEARRVAYRQVELPLTIGIPSDHLTLMPVGGQLVASLEISLGVRDKRDTLSDVLTLPVRLATPLFTPLYPEEARYVYYELSATLRKERHDLVVTVRDVPSGAVLSSRVEIHPQGLATTAR